MGHRGSAGLGPAQKSIIIIYFFSNEVKLNFIQKQSFRAQKIEIKCGCEAF
jgi:hypothetical protein